MEVLMSYCDITDMEWNFIEPVFPNKLRGVPRVDDRWRECAGSSRRRPACVFSEEEQRLLLVEPFENARGRWLERFLQNAKVGGAQSARNTSRIDCSGAPDGACPFALRC